MNKRILIIDDVRDIAEAFKKQLDLCGGYDSDIASGGAEALEMASASHYDLLLLDLVMPDVDGIEVLNAIKADPEKYGHVPVIALTNVTAEDTRKEVEGLGADGYVVKTDAEIETVVAELFNRG